MDERLNHTMLISGHLGHILHHSHVTNAFCAKLKAPPLTPRTVCVCGSGTQVIHKLIIGMGWLQRPGLGRTSMGAWLGSIDQQRWVRTRTFDYPSWVPQVTGPNVQVNFYLSNVYPWHWNTLHDLQHATKYSSSDGLGSDDGVDPLMSTQRAKQTAFPFGFAQVQSDPGDLLLLYTGYLMGPSTFVGTSLSQCELV